MTKGNVAPSHLGVATILTSFLVFNPTHSAKMELNAPNELTKEPLQQTFYESKPLDPIAMEVALAASSVIETTVNSYETLTNTQSNPLMRYDLSKPQTFELTAYTLAPEENGYWGTISSAQYELDGKYLPDRYIAIDPSVVPYHTKIYIEFPEEKRYVEFHGKTLDLNGEYLAVDCGSAIKGNRIDLFVGGNGAYYNQVADGIGRGDVTVYRPLN